MAKKFTQIVVAPQDVYEHLHAGLIDYIEENFTTMPEAMDYLVHTVITMKYNLDTNNIRFEKKDSND